MQEYLSLMPIPGRAAMGTVHPRCAFKWSRKNRPGELLERLARLAETIRAHPDAKLAVSVDSAAFRLTAALGQAIDARRTHVVVAPDIEGHLAYWLEVPRPTIRPALPEMRLGARCDAPATMAGIVVDRLVLGYTPTADGLRAAPDSRPAG